MADTPGNATVEVDGYRVESSSETAESMIKALTPPKVDDGAPKEVKPESKDDDDKDEKSGLSKAASEMGKEGGKAAAAKRAAEAKEKKADEGSDKPEEKPPAKDEGGEDEGKEAGDSRKDARARMLEATRKEAEAKRALAQERAEREALARRLEALERGREKPPTDHRSAERRAAAEAVGKPKPEDFEDFNQYLDARDDWRDQQREARNVQRQQAQQHQQRLRSHVSEFNAKLAEAEKADPGIREKIAPVVTQLSTTFQVPEGQMPTGANWVADELIFSPENAPALMLHFAENPEDLERISALPSPRAVTREMAKLAARLEPAEGNGEDKDKPKPVSKAKPPVKSLTASPPGGDPYEVDDDMDYDEHVRRMNAKERASRKRA